MCISVTQALFISLHFSYMGCFYHLMACSHGCEKIEKYTNIHTQTIWNILLINQACTQNRPAVDACLDYFIVYFSHTFSSSLQLVYSWHQILQGQYKFVHLPFRDICKNQRTQFFTWQKCVLSFLSFIYNYR